MRVLRPVESPGQKVAGCFGCAFVAGGIFLLGNLLLTWGADHPTAFWLSIAGLTAGIVAVRAVVGSKR